MKKYLTLAAVASAVALTTAASAQFEVGIGFSAVNFGGSTKDSTGAGDRNIAKPVAAGDISVAYSIDLGKWEITPLVYVQTGGGKIKYSDSSNIHIHRRVAYAGLIRGGFEIAPKSDVYIKVGTKRGRFVYHNSTAGSKATDKWGFLGGLGFMTQLSEKIALDLGYEHVVYGSVKSNAATGSTTTYKTKLNESNFRLGVAYKF